MSTRIDLDELLLHEAFVRRLARRLVRDEQRAEDLVQDTWVAALERAPNTHVRGWLGSVVRRIWSKELRGEERRHRRELEASRVEASDLLDEAMALEESRRLVVEALFGLTESLRTCLLLRYFEGLPPRRNRAQARYSGGDGEDATAARAGAAARSAGQAVRRRPKCLDVRGHGVRCARRRQCCDRNFSDRRDGYGNDDERCPPRFSLW